ncbi:nucleotidyl transferase AbiEii/AbiGii toxin family protein [Thiothrix lacustris]|uniref:nucleotidyl transferase AbiEii/AbiGii toxin family protein n=1 Tax=Thiothrix lacustris TaxID=525917 RepID=UPI0027E5A7DF|nr:nucleotidyl transferase AbiEii/AbiGii toxin family protein [Thiothrix lacustris]WMP16247.1 nucleotidyl transferase AbiEii/AbiGii toxin family protein [Thiothrix lacustris]
MKNPSNIAASIRQRLLNKARQDQRPFAELLQYYAMERFLYRLSQSPHNQRFILKGALMLRVWQAPETRPTMDIDMLGITDNDSTAILAQITEVLGIAVNDDGMAFDTTSLQAETITQEADYQGVRVRFTGTLDKAIVRLQLDIGFGDLVHPTAEWAYFPTLLKFPEPELLCYSRESAIAEKFEAMVKLGVLNSRMKDFYDIWLLARLYNFKAQELGLAIEKTFKQRGTAQLDRWSFGQTFIANKQVQWLAFHKRLHQPHVPIQFAEIMAFLEKFLLPITQPAAIQTNAIWIAPGAWHY